MKHYAEALACFQSIDFRNVHPFPVETTDEYLHSCQLLYISGDKLIRHRQRLTKVICMFKCSPHRLNIIKRNMRWSSCSVFGSLNVIGLIGGHTADEAIFCSPQSHTPEVKHDQIISLHCCVGLLYMSHRGNRQMKSLKDGYFNSQVLSASLIRFVFRKLNMHKRAHALCFALSEQTKSYGMVSIGFMYCHHYGKKRRVSFAH